jgi:ABC-type lipoprotein release transport system permease subunit
LRAELRDRWRRWLGLAALVGIAAGAVMTLAAAARRTDSAYGRFLHDQRAYDVVVVNYEEDGTAIYDFDEIAALPMVRDAARAAYEYAAPGGAGGTPTVASYDERFGRDLNRFKVLEGRLADPVRPDEAVVSFQVADASDVQIGSRIDVVPEKLVEMVEANDIDGLEEVFGGPIPAEELAAMRTFLDVVPGGEVRVVGIVAAPGEVPPQYQGVFCCVHLTPAFAAAADWTNEVLAVRLHGGASAVPAFVDELERRGGGLEPQMVVQADHAAGVERAIDVQVIALWMLAGLVAGASVLILLQLLARFDALESRDHPTLAALGMSGRQRIVLSLLRALAIGLGGAVIAVAVAVAASGSFPTGLARIVEPDPGPRFDPVVLPLGGVLTVLAVGLLAIPPAWRAAHRGLELHPGGNVRFRTAAVRLPNLHPSAAVGVRMALQRGQGSTAVPVATSLAAVILGAGVVVGALTFSSSLDHLLGTPRLYGVSWDMVVWNGGGSDPVAERLAPIAERHRGVAGLAVGGETQRFEVGGHTVEIVRFDPLLGDVGPPIVDGRRPSQAGEVALGATTMRDLGVDIGDSIDVVSRGGPQARLRVVGQAVLPTIGEELQLGTGGYTTRHTAARLTGEPAAPVDDAALYLALEPGADEDALFAAFEAEMCSSDDLFCELFRLPIDDPTDIVNFGRVRSTPLILGGVLALVAGGALVHVLVTALHQRRRDLALLRVLGFTRGQLRSTVAVQATTFVGVALAIALPLGIAAGAALWRLQARRLGILDERQIPWLTLMAVVLAAVLAANLIAALDARALTRTSPGATLRDE